MAPSKKQNKGKKSRSKKKQYKKKYEKKRKEHTLIGKLKRKFRTWKKRRQRKRKKYAVEDEMDEEVPSEESEIEEYEKKLYWGRAITGVVTSILGVLVFNLVGWDMFIYFILFLLVFPFIISFAILRIPYEKDKWDWKNIMKKGVAPQFFLFMLISTICHTYVVVDNYDTQFNNPADTQAIYIQDEEYMFVADGTNGILSLNHTLPGGHRWLQDSEKPNGSTIAIEMHNGYGYFINTEQGLMIYNMSEPDNLKLVSKNASFTKAADLYISGQLLFISNTEFGLDVYNISTPASPKFISNYNTIGNATKLSVNGNIASLACNKEGVEFLDITDPSSLTQLGSYKWEPANGSAQDIITKDDIAYVAHGQDGLILVNVSDISSPVFISRYNQTNVEEKHQDLIYNNECVYIAAGASGLMCYSIENKTLTLVYDSLGGANRLSLYDNTILISDTTHGIAIVNLENPPASPKPTSTRTKKISFGWMWLPYTLIAIMAMSLLMRKKLKHMDWSE